MRWVLFLFMLVYVAWTITTEHHTECENPDCDNCPFPPCDRSDK